MLSAGYGVRAPLNLSYFRQLVISESPYRGQQAREGATHPAGEVDPHQRAGEGGVALARRRQREDPFCYLRDPLDCLLVCPCPFSAVKGQGHGDQGPGWVRDASGPGHEANYLGQQGGQLLGGHLKWGGVGG